MSRGVGDDGHGAKRHTTLAMMELSQGLKAL